MSALLILFSSLDFCQDAVRTAGRGKRQAYSVRSLFISAVCMLKALSAVANALPCSATFSYQTTRPITFLPEHLEICDSSWIFPSLLQISVKMAGSVVWILFASVVLFFFLRRKTDHHLNHIPIVRYNSWFPDTLNRLIFYSKASLMISRGYAKVIIIELRVLITGASSNMVFSTRTILFAC